MYSFLYRTNLFWYEYDKLKHASIGRGFHSSRSFFPNLSIFCHISAAKRSHSAPGCRRRATGPGWMADLWLCTTSTAPAHSTGTISTWQNPQLLGAMGMWGCRESTVCTAVLLLQIYTQGTCAGGAVNRVLESGWGLPSAVAINLCQQK